MGTRPLRLLRCEERQGAGPVLRASGSSHAPWHPQHPNGVTVPSVGRKTVPGPRPGSHRASEGAVGPGPCAPSPSFCSGGSRPRPAPCLCRDGWRTPAHHWTPGREGGKEGGRKRILAQGGRAAFTPPPWHTAPAGLPAPCVGTRPGLALHKQRRRHGGPEASGEEQMLGAGLFEGPQPSHCPEGVPGGAGSGEGPMRCECCPHSWARGGGTAECPARALPPAAASLTSTKRGRSFSACCTAMELASFLFTQPTMF